MSKRITAAAVLLLPLASAAFAGAPGVPEDGEWGGADRAGRSAQLIVIGGELTSVYLLDDYYQPSNVRVRRDGNEIDFDVGRAKVLFVRTVDGGLVTVRLPGKPPFDIPVGKD